MRGREKGRTAYPHGRKEKKFREKRKECLPPAVAPGGDGLLQGERLLGEPVEIRELLHVERLDGGQEPHEGLEGGGKKLGIKRA